MSAAAWVLSVHQFGGSTSEAVTPGFVAVMPDEVTAKAYQEAFNNHPKVRAANRYSEVSAWAHPVDLVLAVSDADDVDPAVLGSIFASRGVSWLLEED